MPNPRMALRWKRTAAQIMTPPRPFPFEFPFWSRTKPANSDGLASQLEGFELQLLRDWASRTPAIELAQRMAHFLAETIEGVSVGIYRTSVRGQELFASASLPEVLSEAANRPDALSWLTTEGLHELELGPLHITDPRSDGSAIIRADHIGDTQIGSAWIARTPELLTLFVLRERIGGFSPEQLTLLQNTCELLSRVSAPSDHLTHLHSLKGLAEEIVESSSSMLCVFDIEGRVMFGNQALASTFGREAGELVGEDLSSRLVHTRDRRHWQSWLNLTWRNEGEVRHEAVWNALGDQERILEWVGTSILSPQGKLVIATGRDVTNDRKIEGEREEYSNALRHAQKMEDIGTLASGIAHDFNNHLTAIIGFTDLAASTAAEDAPIQSSLKEVTRAARLAAGVTRALLTFTRKTSTNRESCELGKIVDESMKLLSRVLPSAIHTELKLPAEGECVIWADTTHVQQIIMCLVINARDAMDDGGTLKVEVESVDGSGPRKSAALRVHDTGIGMDTAVKSRIFEPFFTTKPRGLGTGLGLSVMRSLVLEHGGRIEFDSNPGQGTSFEVIFPAQAPIPETEPTKSETAEKLVLVAEENDFFRSILVSSLRQEGYQVLEALSPATCSEVCEAHSDVLDLVILAREMLSEEATAWTTELLRLQPTLRLVMIEGADDMSLTKNDDPRVLSLCKPFTVPELTETVHDILGSKSIAEGSPR
ncbi:MAG: PAS domain S-box-containing protein [Planctomycetota bacterium]|jgi:PAS domain S-box-containing protein